MTTLRGLSAVVTGLYRDACTGRVYRHDELTSHLPMETLSQPLWLERRDFGVYHLYLESGAEFQLLSRRRNPRRTPQA